jgi:hypothetical protein
VVKYHNRQYVRDSYEEEKPLFPMESFLRRNMIKFNDENGLLFTIATNYLEMGVLMNKIMIDSYKLDRISTRMAKDFGTIPKGQEDRYAFILSAMEGNLLKLHRQDLNRSGRRALSAIQMALLTVDGYIKQVEYDFSSHTIPEN